MDTLNLQQVIEIVNRLDVELDLRAAVSRVSDLALSMLDCERVTLWHVLETRKVRTAGVPIIRKTTCCRVLNIVADVPSIRRSFCRGFEVECS